MLRRVRILCVWIGLMLAAAAQADALRIGSWDRRTDTLVIVGEAILSQAYAEIGQPVEFLEFPIRRAMVMMLNGELDGNVFRIAALGKEQPSLYQIETPITFTEVRLYTANSVHKVHSWGQLSGLRVAYQRGTLIAERNLPADCQRVEAGSIVELFRLLNHGAAEFALIVEPAQSRPHLLSGAYGITRTDGVLESTPLHHYLLEKHHDLGLRLNTVLKRMAASGEIQSITSKTLQSLE